MKIKFSLICMVLLITVFSSLSHAVDFWSIQLGTWSEADKYDSAVPANMWTVRSEVVGTVTIGLHDYFLFGTWDYEPGGSYHETPIRSTETAAYYYDGVDDRLAWQMAPVGTMWSFSDTSGGEVGQMIREIVSIESVTVPYGTFGNAYVHRNYFDPDNPALSNSPYWYEYVVPGVGMVKEVDYYWPASYNPPTVQELRAVGVVPEPVSSTLFLIGGATLGFRRFRKKFKK